MAGYFSILLAAASFSPSPALRAAPKPHAVPVRTNATWTNEDLERLNRIPGLISVVGRPANETAPASGTPAPRSVTEDSVWYAAQAASLNARLEAERANLCDFTQALDDARELKNGPAGIDLSEDWALRQTR